MLTLGSLFDGSGGFPLAGAVNGFEPVWASEVEPYPIAVTRSRFPQMLHLGNVCEVNGAMIKPVDVITFGSPCQSLSVAGKREGLRHTDLGDDETTRSGLFMEAVRIITEMRKETNGEFPKFCCWENVPGALSSSGGADFLAVLENLAKIADPEVSIPKPDKWCANGEIIGDGFSLAWRIIDARHFGVTVRDGDTDDVLVRGTPQRRRRIYLVADFRGTRAGKILFECAGVQGNSEPCAETRQGTAADVKGSVGADDCIGFDGYNGELTGDVQSTLGVNCDRSTGRNGAILNCMHDQQAVLVLYRQGGFADYVENEAGTVRAAGGDYGGDYGGGSETLVRKNYLVRRLTPTECARLQGFPDTWGHPDIKTELTDEEYTFWQTVRDTHAEIGGKPQKTYTREQMLKWYNKLHTDSAEYKMWGNGIALPCAHFVLNRIAKELTHDNQNPTADA